MQCLILGLLLCAPDLIGPAEPQTPAEQYQALVRGYEAALKVPTKAYDNARNAGERLKASEHWPWRMFAPRFLELAEAHPDDPASFDALIWVASNAPMGPATDRAVEILIRDHIKSERFVNAFEQPFRGGPAVMTLYRAAIEASPHRAVRARASMKLAGLLSGIAHKARAVREKSLSEAESRYWNDTVQKEYFALVCRSDPDAATAEAESLYERVATTYADVKGKDGKPLGEVALAYLSELRELAIGSPAPEVEGLDLEGMPMRLSDHRGKVVVLNFWSTSCGICMTMIPDERALVRRLEGRPFVLLGVNDDEDKEVARKAVKDRQIIWRSWWDGKVGGPIDLQWNIQGWPTTYVLDHHGVIRYKNLRGPQLDKVVDQLVKEAEARPRDLGSRK